ncbi:stage III sporulation protein SpoIIIAB [Inediibacterium massiliense]|uniref:stage III sporulation protein SpoIIIAB n=1 Tax=Inediibacterium massiliense TaxID=1658111 RepID=UPI0006B57D40|nr:stage III sporulation protein SpoIIIAB [Inediibacterium massiliense]
MIVKILCSIFIILSSSTIGYLYSLRYFQRLQQLKDLYISFQLLETEITYVATPLATAMQKIGNQSNQPIHQIFKNVHKILSQRMGYSVEEAWYQAIENHFNHTALTEEDREILIDFGKNLGCTDQENQTKNFKWIYLQLQKHQQNADELKNKNGKLCKNMGVLAGLAIVIILI